MASEACRYVTRAEREHRRYAHDVAVTFHVGTTAIEGRTRNVSRGGLCATLTDAIDAGTDLDVDIVLVFDDGIQSEALRLPGRVAWCTTVDEANQIGISFRGLDKARTEYLGMFLRYLDDTRTEKPAREQSVDDRFR
jgi:PilZ domain